MHIPQNSSKIPAKLKRSSAGSSLRPAILNLAEKFESAGGWGSERIFSKWVSKQPWRQCLPPIFQFEVERETCLTIHIFLKFQERTLSKQTTHFLYLSQRLKVGFSDTIGFEQKRSSCIPWEGPFSAVCMRQMHSNTLSWTASDWECFFLMKWYQHSITLDLVICSLAS